MDWFAQQGCQIITGAKNIKVTERGLAYEDKDGTGP